MVNLYVERELEMKRMGSIFRGSEPIRTRLLTFIWLKNVCVITDFFTSVTGKALCMSDDCFVNMVKVVLPPVKMLMGQSWDAITGVSRTAYMNGCCRGILDGLCALEAAQKITG